MPTTELLSIKEKITKWTEDLEKDETLWGNLEFKLEDNLNDLCHEVIEKSYETLQSLFADKFKERYP